MKYIRTKDKIYKVDEKEMIACPNDDGTTDVYYKLESGKLVNRDDVIKEADRLEYLMDCYAVNEDIVRQQLALRTTADALKALQEKESVYAGMAVRINAISQNYEDALKRSHDLEVRNNELRHLAEQHNKFYAEQKKITTESLESMLSLVLSAMEEYFSLPLHEKNKPSTSNRTKTAITKIVMDTIQAIEKGKTLQ